jgi:hypothetical protein
MTATARDDAPKSDAELLAEMTCPDLGEFIRANGGYANASAAAWAAFSERKRVWDERYRRGDFWKPPYLALRSKLP